MHIFLLFATLLVFSNFSFGQDIKPKKFYLETSGGYGFPIVNDDLGSTNDLIGSANRLIRSDSTIKITPAQGTQGAGWQFSFNAGYMFHPNIGFEGQINYLKSNRYFLAKNITPTFQAEHGVLGERLDIIPQLVFSFQFREKWSLFSKSGVVIPLWGRSNSEIIIDDQEGRLVQEVFGFNNPNSHAAVRIKASSYGKFSYGFQTRLGVGYSFLDWLTVFGEVKFVALSIRSKEDRVNEFSIQFINGQTGELGLRITEDDLSEMDKTTIYLNELTENSNNQEVNSNADSSQPLEALSTKNNFNQLAVSFGIRFYIK